MGGAPTISGGMSQSEYQKLLDEQRVYAEEAEAKREAKLAEYDQNRIKAEKDLLEAQKLAEQQKIAAQQDAEAQIAEEVQAMGQQEQTKKWTDKPEVKARRSKQELERRKRNNTYRWRKLLFNLYFIFFYF
jgi:hypothetical protein